MANQNIKVRVSSSHSDTRYFYVQVQEGAGEESSSFIYVGSTKSGDSAAESAQFSTSVLYDSTASTWEQYDPIKVYASTAQVNLTSSITSSSFSSQTGVIDQASALIYHPDAPGSYSPTIGSNAYYLDITYPSTDPTGSGWQSWSQYDSNGDEADLTGPSSMTASFTGSTNTEIKLVFNERVGDSSGDKWTISTLPGINSYSGFGFSASGSSVSNVGIDSVSYSTTTVDDDTVVLGISYDGTVGSGETLSVSLTKSYVYDQHGNQATGYGNFSTSDLSWPTTGGSGRTYYNRTFKLTNTSSSTVYFVMGVDDSEGTNGSSYVEIGSVAASGTESLTVNQEKLNDWSYGGSTGSKALYAFSSSQNSSLSSSWQPWSASGKLGEVYVNTSYMDTATDGRIEYSFDGSSFSGPTIYDTDGNLVDVSLNTPTVTVTNSSGTGIFTVDYGEKIYKGDYGASSFSSLSEITQSDIGSPSVSNSGGSSDVSSLSITDFEYATSDDSGALAVYGTDNTGNYSGAEGWWYPVYLTQAGAGGSSDSHAHTFSEYSGTTFYMPNGTTNHGVSSAPSDGTVHYHDQLKISFSYSGTASTDDTLSIGWGYSVSYLYDANLNSGSAYSSNSASMQSDSSGGIDMSTKQNLNRLSVNSNFVPQGSSKTTITLGSSDDAWSKLYLGASGLYLAGTAVTATAAELNDLAGNAVDADDFTKLAAVTASAAELNYLASFADSTFAQASDSIVFWDADASAIRHETTAAFLGAVGGDGFEVASSKLKVLLDESSAGDSGLEVGSDGLKISAAKVTNAMLAGSIANGKLANSTISGVALGGTLGALSDGNGIADFSYTGAGTASIAIELDESSAGDSGLSVGSDGLKIAAAKVTNAMLAGSIANGKLANSTISGVALGGTLGALSDGNGIADFSYTGAGTASIAIELDEASAGDSGLSVGSDGLKIAAAKVTNAMLAGSIANGKLANSAVTVTAGNGLTGGGSVSLGDSVSAAIELDEASAGDSGLSVGEDGLKIAAAKVTNAMLAGSIANGKLANSSVTIAGSSVSLGGSVAASAIASAIDGEDMAITGLTDLDVKSAGDITILDTVGANTITVGASSGTVHFPGNISVAGATTTIESTTVQVDDKNIELGVVDTPTDTTADGGGITLKGATDKTFNWVDSSDSWTSSEHMDLASGKEFKIDGTKVLDASGAAKVGSGVAGDGLAHDSGVLSVELDESSAGDSGLSVGSDGVKIAAGKVTNAMLAGSIANGKLANSTISGVALGGALSALSDGNGIADFSYTGAGTASIAIELDEASAGDSGLSVGSDGLKIAAAKVTNAMLAGSIANGKLANSTISGVALGGTLGALSDGNGIADFSYTGAGTASIAIELDESSAGDSGLSVGSDGLKIAAAKVTNAMLAGSIVDSKLNQITTADKVAGSALELASSGGLEDDSGIKISEGGVARAMIADDAVNADKLADTAVTAGSYGGSLKRLTATVDAQGRLTAMAEATIQDAAADGSTKGVAAFDSGDFSASSGVIALKADSVGATELKDDVAGSGLRITNGVLSIVHGRQDAIRTDAVVADRASSKRVITVDLGASGLTWVEGSVQVYLNGMLLRKDVSSAGDQDYGFGNSGNVTTYSGNAAYLIDLHDVDSGDAMPDDDDIITVTYILAG